MYPWVERASIPDARVGSGYCTAKLQLPLADVCLWSVTLQTVSNYIPLLHSFFLFLLLLLLSSSSPPSPLLHNEKLPHFSTLIYVTKELY